MCIADGARGVKDAVSVGVVRTLTRLSLINARIAS